MRVEYCCVPGAMLPWIRHLDALSLKCLPLRSRADTPIKNEVFTVQVQPSCKENTTYTKHKTVSSMRAGMFVHYLHSCTSAPPIAWHIMLTGYLSKRNESQPLFPKHRSVSLQSREGLGTEKSAGDEQAGTPWSHKAKKWCLLPWEALQLVQEEEMPSNW